MILIPEKSQIV